MQLANNKLFVSFILFTLIFFLWSILVCFLWRQHVVLTIIMILIGIIYFRLFKRKDDYIYFAVAAIFGPVGEVLGTTSGLWKYNGFTVFGIPYWLPLAWGLTAVMVKRLITSVTDIKHELRRNS